MFVAKAHNPPLAAVLITAASALLAGTTLLAKALGTDTLGPALHPMQISHGRFLFAFIVIVTAVGVMRPRLQRPHWGLHIGRTSFGWVGITLMFASVAFIPIADATAISFLNPVFAMVLAIPLLKEGVGPWRWLAAAVALAGALILLRPTPDSFQPAALLALTAAAVIGMELIFIKKLSGREIPIQILLINNAMGLTIASVAVSFVFQMPTLETMGGAGGYWRIDGLRAGVFCERHGAGRCLICCPDQLCDADFCRFLRFRDIRRDSGRDQHDRLGHNSDWRTYSCLA